jgi:hypothetical protein
VVRRAELLRARQYLAGTLVAEEYLRGAGESRVDQCNVHFFVGLTRLAEGDRSGARDHFRSALRTGAFSFIHYTLSQVILNRMERDAAWPRLLDRK